MIRKPMTVQLASGLEARPVAVLVQVASQYESKIYVEIDNKKVNAKSIMGMMSMNFANGSEITIAADGQDEEAAVNALADYLTKNK